ncbi:NAD(P)-binding domain-containing protein [Tenacibaculum sp. M341]|uniref:NAD(P)-binding domain-containing protein n=1 Tax=Tenacibaculum sp. M341 TaxID=2530339 RepID=UPI00104B6713|nr:NAD(P)-binding domain-containing protein [Tenacibaculum sp. M341]TCI85718.1 pyridine nucleotide-disulfide oxidoreductase [Tenacibaculum sp. M341]
MQIKHKDYIIIGAGPAGLQLGYFLKKYDLDFLIVEKNDVAGSYFKEYPRHRTLISINKVHTGFEDKNLDLRFDWNSLLCDKDELLFKEYSTEYFPNADLFVDYLNDFANAYELPIDYGVDIVNIKKEDKFLLSTSSGQQYTCNYLVVATGWAKPYIPEIPGIEYGDHYMTMSLNKKDYENKRVLIIGKGNSAFETADDLIASTATTHVCSENSLVMAWNSHYVGNLRAVNNNFLDTYQLKAQNAVLDAAINHIKKEGEQYRVNVTYNNNASEEEELVYDAIILCTGFRFDDAIFDESCKPELIIKDRFPNQESDYQSTNISQLYYAGTITHMRDYKKQASGFVHGFRYNASCLARILAYQNHNIPMPSTEVAWDIDALGDKFIDRINSNSSLWNQYGYLGDVAVIKEDKVFYYNSLPIDFIKEQFVEENDEYFVLTMEFGKKMEAGEHTSVNRVHRNDYENAKNSAFIHPIIRHYKDGKEMEEFHIIEDLEAVWKEPIHIEPLKKFIKEVKQASLTVSVQGTSI